MNMFLQNFFLGFIITAVPGAVFFETIRRTLTHKASMMMFMAGNFCGMFLIIFSVLVGLSALLSNQSLHQMFYMLSGVTLLYIGTTSFLTKYDNWHSVSLKTKGGSDRTAFFTGFVLAAANPISIVFWIAITGKIIQEKASFGVVVLNCLSIVLGAALVFVLLIIFANIAKNKIKVRHLVLLSRSFGLIILIYGAVALSKAL